VPHDSMDQDSKTVIGSYALRLKEGLEFAEFEPAPSRLTAYHVLGTHRQISAGHTDVYLLHYFLKNPGKILSRQELLDHVWSDRVVSPGSLNQAISSLRTLLGDEQKREIILTIPRRGYQFNAETLVDWQEWLERKRTILSITLTDSPSPVIAPGAVKLRRRNLPLLRGLVGGLSLTLIGGVLSHYYFWLFPPYVSQAITTDHTQLTLLAASQAELESTHTTLLPTLKRLDALGGGHALVNSTKHQLQFFCFRVDGSVHTLFVPVEHLQTLADVHWQECFK
jgi:cholera toxin transcriptional activator